jgi:hypothetical protein
MALGVLLGGAGCEPRTGSITRSLDVPADRSCGTAVPSDDEVNAADVAPDVGRDDGSPIVIDVAFHVLNLGPGIENGDLTDDLVRGQIAVMNDVYGGRTGGAPTRFSFQLVSIDHTTNAEWFDMTVGSPAEAAAKAALRTGGPGTLNIYSGGLAHSHLGWSTFPWQYQGHELGDSVVVAWVSVPGANDYVPPSGYVYNRGITAVHEAGHWLGLLHTFQGGCNNANDHVEDTPAEAVPHFFCDVPVDSCPKPGLDPIHNVMDYTNDLCAVQFTNGQGARAGKEWTNFRAFRH